MMTHDQAIFREQEERAEQAQKDIAQLKDIVYDRGWDWKTVTELIEQGYMDATPLLEED